MGQTPVCQDQSNSKQSVLPLVFIFLLATVFLGLGMSAMPGTYDEGIVLTGGLRTLAGQMPHQDFYVNYGPLAYYTLGWLFRVFGVSLLAERILFSIISGLIVTTLCGITMKYCGRWIVGWTTLSIVLWLFGLNSVSGSAMYPVSLLNLVCVALILRVYVRRCAFWTLLGAGSLTAVSELIRYDTGTALFGVISILLAFGVFVRASSEDSKLKEVIVSLLIYASGFALIIVPALLYYLSRGRLEYFVHDIIVYPSKYYRRARGMPFPGIHLRSLDNIAVYLPMILAIIALYIGVRGCLALRSKQRSEGMEWHGMLASFGFLGFIMYLKGVVRASPPQMYLSMLPGLLLIAVLYEHRTTFKRPLVVALPWLLTLSVGTAGLETLREVRAFHKQRSFLPLALLAELRGKLSPIDAEWCKIPSPLTKGICFLPDEDRIQTIEFIRSHTQPTDKLFMGVPHHDRIFGNDNITYFATERLPVTKWSDFDPLLQNQLPIQEEIVQEFNADPPPYIVLDAEFDKIDEPNESSKSSGVTLLDDYLRKHYTPIETHGMLSIYKRTDMGS